MSTCALAMTKVLRKDAAERRVLLLEAAAAEFAERGYDVPLDAIADRAGVGRATLYRNFADRSELALAVYAEQLADLDRRTRERGEDPAVFFWFVDELAAILMKNAGLDAALREARSPEALAPVRQRLVEAGTGPLKRAQDAGLVRPDLDPQDLRAIAMILGAGANRPDPADREAFGKRVRALLLDGLRIRP